MILLIGIYLLFKGIFWCFAAMIWLCFAWAVWGFVLCAALIMVWFDRPATVRLIKATARNFGPPDYLRSRHRRRVVHV